MQGTQIWRRLQTLLWQSWRKLFTLVQALASCMFFPILVLEHNLFILIQALASCVFFPIPVQERKLFILIQALPSYMFLLIPVLESKLVRRITSSAAIIVWRCCQVALGKCLSAIMSGSEILRKPRRCMTLAWRWNTVAPSAENVLNVRSLTRRKK